jgi:dihydroceramidase
VRRKVRNVAIFGYRRSPSALACGEVADDERAAVSFGFGYFVWLMDDWLCQFLTSFRHSVGVPFAFLTELHGWCAYLQNPSHWSSLMGNRWHVFTAVGGYVAVTIVDTITSGEVLEDPVDSFAWPVPMAARLVTGATAVARKSQVS